MDKASLPETLAEKRAKRAAARKASRPDAVAQSDNKSQASNEETAATSSAAATSRSELLRRARQARKESAVALGTSAPMLMDPDSPASSRRSSDLRSMMSSTRKELSMRDLMTAAGDSRRKLKENDSRMERLTQKQKQLQKPSPLSSPSGGASKSSIGTSSRLSADDGLSLSSQHSLHERKPRARALKNPSRFREENENASDDPIGEDSKGDLQDVDEFGGEAISSTTR
jgi:hypothetical protein